ncbi:MAG: hypothetical protein IJX17_02365 [Clostridia bacterium]|nr:hypothetical protein [Clostridia bacterium]
MEEIKLVELEDENLEYFSVDNNALVVLKNNYSINKFEKINLKLDFEVLGLGKKLYGKSKEESKMIQKSNCKMILKLNKTCEKLIKFLIKNNIDFGNKIYIQNLKEKKNNNDFLIYSLLNLKFNKYKDKMAQIITFSCDYLNAENTINNMCDFRDNKCVSCRDRNIDRVIGCCQKNCKFAHTGVCNVKNISCKLYMCDYIENKGYYFSPYYLPITKKYFSLTQRFVSTCLLFKSLDFQTKVLKLSKFLPLIFIAFIIVVILVGII